MSDPRIGQRLPRALIGSVAALAVASALLFTVVLPAEYGFDPLGTGAALGLTGMAQRDRSPLADQSGRWVVDQRQLRLEPFESVEIKYRLAVDETMVFRWRANGELVYDLHAEPDGAAPGYAQHFAEGRSHGAHGSYRATFAGIHGWFWENRGPASVDLQLEVSGYPRWRVEFRDGFERRHDFGQPGHQPRHQPGP